jgi:putative two-component system response regulator
VNPDALTGARILVVDDQPANVLLLQRVLERDGFTHIKTTTDSREVLPLFAAFEPDLLLLDLHMPHTDGFELLSQIRPLVGEDTYLPVLVLTADMSKESRQAALTMGANDFLTKPFETTEVLLRVRNLLHTRMLHLRLADRSQGFAATAERERAALEEARLDTLTRLALAAELRDDDTSAHTQRVGDLSAEIAARLGADTDEQELLRRAAPLHDIGKLGVRDAVLLKPGPLTEEEFAHIRTHTTVGARLLTDSPTPILKAAEIIALNHHERWDGTGYPNSLAGLAIPHHARIVAVADVYDALTHARPYKQAWTIDRSITEISAQRGLHFDPDVVDAFLMTAMADHH